MTKNDLLKMVEDPRYISGIYNYCDRWCERCPFTSRCLLYAQEQQDPEDRNVKDINSEAFWQKLHSIFAQTFEMINTMAKEQGIDLSGADEVASQPDRDKREEAENHELSRAAMEYAKMTDEWLELYRPLLEQKEKDLNTRFRLGLDKDAPTVEAAGIVDALEVIQWYQHQIYVKLARALTHEDFEDEPQASIQTDANGSTKVALIAMERSIAAWMELHNYLSDPDRKILNLLLHLDRLRRRTDQLFPNAKKFIRPGFDTGDNPRWESGSQA